MFVSLSACVVARCLSKGGVQTNLFCFSETFSSQLKDWQSNNTEYTIKET